jgi:hypothetical protein
MAVMSAVRVLASRWVCWSAQVDDDASTTEIKKAYRSLAKTCQ